MSYGLSYDYNPPLHSLTAHQVSFVGRNLNGSYHLTRLEADALQELSVSIVSVYLASDKGEEEAQEAAKLAQAVGMPEDRPIYFALAELDKGLAEDYLRGAQRALGLHRVGVIAGHESTEWLRSKNSASYYWQINDDHSGGVFLLGNNLERYAKSKIGGIDCSEVRSNTKDFGQWQVGADPFPLTKDS